MLCPICGAPAENITRAEFDGLGVRCRNCGEFEVASTAVNDLLRLAEPNRLEALAKAKAIPATAIPEITTACL